MIRLPVPLVAAVLAGGLLAAPAAAAGPLAATPDVRTSILEDDALRSSLAAAHRVVDLEAIRLDGLPAAAESFSLQLPIDGGLATVRLAPHSVRSAEHFRVLADVGGGELVEHAPGPLPTVRGTVDGRPELAVSGGLVGGGLKLVVAHPDGHRTVLEPAGAAVVADAAVHLVYEAAAVIPMPGHACGNEAVAAPPAARARARADAGSPMEAGAFDVAELAGDADFEYFQDYGSVAAVQARIETVINTVNQQYESQVSITHEITTIIVRTSSSDPYTQSGSFGLLCEFITEWTDNQGLVPRDVAHLFTGRNVDGGTIGRAADIGGTGICEPNGGCSGGQFDTFGSYCFAESDFNGNFASATDLTAHELGHLWGAFHCSCPSFTMNAFITSANQFSGGSISSISSYRDSRTCLNVPTEVPDPGPCCLPNQVCLVIDFESACVGAGGTFLGSSADCGDCAELVGACCLPSGACVPFDEATCASVGGVFAGNGTTCGEVSCGPDCPADVDGNGTIEFDDLLTVLSAFGPCAGCPEDVDADGEVGFSDLLEVLSAFGPCR